MSYDDAERKEVSSLSWRDVSELRRAAARVRLGTEAGKLGEEGREGDFRVADHLDSLADRIAAFLSESGVGRPPPRRPGR